MPLSVPTIANGDYQQLLDEAIARIPVHNPEWTNFNDSDPGITLVQLFAFMSENLIYRSNLIPERNRRMFLRLLDIDLHAASAAQGIVTFSNPRGPLQATTLPADLELFAGQVPFRTSTGLDVLPIEAHIYYKKPLTGDRAQEAEALYRELYDSFQEQEQDVTFTYYETRALEQPTNGAAFPVVDLARDTHDGLWLALLARSKETVVATRKAIANRVLTLGILPSLSDATRTLLPGGRPSEEEQPTLLYELPKMVPLSTQTAERVASYQPVPDVRPSGNLLAEPGIVQLSLPGIADLDIWQNLEPLEQGVGDFPPALEDSSIEERIVTWIRIRARTQSGSASQQLSARISWVGVNAAQVIQSAYVFAETLGRGSGEPDQAFTLVNTPVIPASVRLTVNGEIWQEIDDLYAAGAEVPVHDVRLTPGASNAAVSALPSKVYTIERESGMLRFGDGLHGARPPAGSIIQASYAYGGGRQGMLGVGAITKGLTLSPGLKVTNPIPTWGGDEAETVAQAERRISRYVQHRDRLVSATDFKEITWRTPGVDLGRVEILPLFHPDLGDVLAQGVVTVLVVPRYDSLNPETPEPDRLFLDTICSYLNPRRVITTEVHVRGSIYVPVWVSVGIDVIPGRDVAPVREEVKAAIKQFLSPLTGGFEQKGWPLEKTVEAGEILAVATRVAGVAKVNQVLIESAQNTGNVPITGLQLPRLAGLGVQLGQPQSLAELRGTPADIVDGERSPKVLPIPVIPEECL